MNAKMFVAMFMLASLISACAQKNESRLIGQMREDALQHGTAYQNLDQLCKIAPARMIGSPNMAKAIQLTLGMMDQLHPDTLYLQPVLGPHWEAGNIPAASIASSRHGQARVRVLPLGNSVATPPNGITAKVVEVTRWSELDSMGKGKIAGNIVFFNRRMDTTGVSPFAAYGNAVDQRVQGASRAARLGAVAVLVRSVTTRIDTFPHTGVMYYMDSIPKIPAVAISTADAEQLHRWLKDDPSTRCTFRTNCTSLPPAPCFNVIAELKGSEYPRDIITVGGHLDCWYNADGANDDGAGCVQSIEVLRLLKDAGYKPRHTIRIVMFMDEEISLAGGKKYAESLQAAGEKPVLGVESDRGSFAPVGFGISADSAKYASFLSWEKYFTAFGIPAFTKGGGGADVSPLGRLGAITTSYIPNGKTYFDYHHSADDKIDHVNPRDLEEGSAAMATFVYLFDKYR